MEDFLKSYKRTLEELRRDYPKYKVWSDNYFFTFYGQILEEQIINEFITKTIDINKTVEELKNRFSEKFYGVKKDNGDIIISFENGLKGIVNSQFENIDKINKFMDSFGWFPEKVNGFKFNEKTLEIEKDVVKISVYRKECSLNRSGVVRCSQEQPLRHLADLKTSIHLRTSTLNKPHTVHLTKLLPSTPQHCGHTLVRAKPDRHR